MINVGMVGAGNISGIYLENFAKVFREVKLVAVCDLIKERAEIAQKKNNIPKIYDTMHQMFADPDIDLILNITRPYQHYEVSKAALLAGKNVYCEKPLGADLEEGRELLALAKEKNLFLGGAPDTFMGAGIQTARKLLDAGTFGKVIGCRAAMCCHGMESWHTDPDFYYQRGGGPLFDMGPYYITAFTELFGSASEVTAKASRGYDTRLITAAPHTGEIIQVNVDTHIESLITFESGLFVSLLTSFDIYNSRQANIEIYNEYCTLYVPDPNCFSGDLVFYDGRTSSENHYPITFGYAKNSRALGLADAAKSIETGRDARASVNRTYHVLEIMCGILESAEKNIPVKIESHFDRTDPMDCTLPIGIL